MRQASCGTEAVFHDPTVSFDLFNELSPASPAGLFYAPFSVVSAKKLNKFLVLLPKFHLAICAS